MCNTTVFFSRRALLLSCLEVDVYRGTAGFLVSECGRRSSSPSGGIFMCGYDEILIVWVPLYCTGAEVLKS